MRLDKLTDRQRQVCDLIIKGYSLREIADMLGVGEKTIQGIRKNGWAALGVTNSTQLLAIYVLDAVDQVRARLPMEGIDAALSPLDFVVEVLS